MTRPDPDVIVRHLGLQPYVDTWNSMKTFTASRTDNTPDELWCVQHPPVYTQGQAGKAEHILAPGDIPVVQVDRGGQVTYHGPGQLVIYLMIDLHRARFGVRELVTHIEEAIVEVLADVGIESAPRKDAPGVYTEGTKIASLGLRVSKGRSFHGLALNVDMDLEPFSRINPCGLAGMPMSQVVDWCPTSGFDDIEQALIGVLQRRLDYGLVEHSAELPAHTGA
ncbi:lipoyl(octanoyl) transferase LipB [Marinobacter sp. V034]|uniref:lipoyl(octanoyl) transferase LipB n=1 Tax=Marinobacter sp. V034 TaxID=3459610 RepID=UPI004044AA32